MQGAKIGAFFNVDDQGFAPNHYSININGKQIIAQQSCTPTRDWRTPVGARFSGRFFVGMIA